ncbi:MAG TPA: TetR/AcrR family transcriptional regulator [Ktedonobacteraceae bacterium]
MKNEKSILSPQERRQRNREEMKNAILEAARQVMREEGVAALNLQEVARRVGVRAPSLYEYFAGKMALYDALFRVGVRLYAERMSRLNEITDSFWERSRAGLENYMTFAQEYPELYQLVFERPVPGFVPSEESMAESRRLLTMSNEIVEKGIEQGSIALGITASQARDLFLAMMHGLTALHMANEPELPIGSGRFGSLIPAALALFRTAWEQKSSQARDGQAEKEKE